MTEDTTKDATKDATPSTRSTACSTACSTAGIISRQAAIDELPYLLDYDGLKGENGFVSKRLVRKMLKELPPAPPYYVTGFWLIRRWGDDAKCSNCGKTFKYVYDMDNYDAFCRCCGAKMEGLRVIK